MQIYALPDMEARKLGRRHNKQRNINIIDVI